MSLSPSNQPLPPSSSTQKELTDVLRLYKLGNVTYVCLVPVKTLLGLLGSKCRHWASLWVDGQCDFSSASCIYCYPSWTQVSESQDEHTCCGTSTSEEFVFTSQRSNDQWDSASLVFSVEAQWPRSCCRTATTIRWQNESRICCPVGRTVEKKFWTCYTVQSPPLAAAWLTKLMFLVFQKGAAAPRSYSSCLCLQEKLTG